MILVEGSDTDGLTSITVRMEYLFIFQLSYSELCVWETDEGEAWSIILLILFFLAGGGGGGGALIVRLLVGEGWDLFFLFFFAN